MRIAFYEDRNAEALNPLALLRPVFELVCGQFCLRERLLRRWTVTEWGAFVRRSLHEAYREAQPEARINDIPWLSRGPTLLLNGRWLPTLGSLANIDPQDAGFVGTTLAYLTLDPLEAPLLSEETWDDALMQIACSRRQVQASGRLAAYPWDLVNHNAEQLADDFRLRRYGLPQIGFAPHIALLGPLDQIYVDSAARVDPFVVLDARNGPVSIESGAVVGPFTHLQGPCHIAGGTRLFRAQVRAGTTIGPDCRVGGEIEACILHGRVNKYHTGFLGHSYICPWVNLGALSTNSDLKNDYSDVRVPVGDKLVESGIAKVGCFVGDHTKTGLGSLFNTGSSIGVMCMILPDGQLLPKHIPSFSCMWHGELSDAWPLERSLEAARVVMERRNRELTPAQERLLRSIYDQTAGERAQAISRFRATLRRRQQLLPS